ncbi:MAG: response regulator [Oscillospiraceae bacterium]|nr:response regulator [Oscillospiraceae bacterium]
MSDFDFNFKLEKEKEREKPTVLIVDDVEINRMILDDMLQDKYNIEQASSGYEALEKLKPNSGARRPSLVLLDIMMPGMDGFEALKKMRSNASTSKIPVMFISAADPAESELKGLSVGAIDYIVKPFSSDIVKLRIDNQMELAMYREDVERAAAKKVSAMMEAKEKMLTTMASLIEHRSLESGEHVKRTALLTEIIAEILLENPLFRNELINSDYKSMVKAAPLHDIGKIGVPDDILLKPGKLTPEEFSQMESHATEGSAIIESMNMGEGDDLYLRHCYDICRYHHERWDGKGYPDKISGDDIPLSARIVSIVDVYDALVSQRIYKPPFSHEDAIKIIESDAGKKFDARIVGELLKNHELFKNVYK